MTDLPTGSYTSTVTNKPALNGEMIISGTNDSPAVSYKGVSATNVSWNSDSATITFSFQGWTFTGSYDSTNEAFSGTADNGKSPTAEPEAWSAESEDKVTSARQAKA